MKWAFSDESRRPGVMVVGVVVIATHDVADARSSLRRLLFSGQRGLHMTDERDRRRSQILSGVLELPIRGFVLRAPSSGTSIVRVRKQLLVNTVDRLLDEGVERWTLDGV